MISKDILKSEKKKKIKKEKKEGKKKKHKVYISTKSYHRPYAVTLNFFK